MFTRADHPLSAPHCGRMPLMFACHHPPWLAVALVLAAAATWAAWISRHRSWRWRPVGLLLPACSAIAIALALAQLSLSTAPRVVILLDFSASTASGPPAPWRDPAF